MNFEEDYFYSQKQGKYFLLKSLGAINVACLFTIQPQTLFFLSSRVSIFYRFIAYDAKTTRATQSVVYPLAEKFDPVTLKINRVPDSIKD
jgi:hypothetical protein